MKTAQKVYQDVLKVVNGAAGGNCQGLEYEFADTLGAEGSEADELVERLLTRGAMSVVYGDSNSGKTFAAIDIGAAVARGIKWMDRNVEPGAVLYLASESPASVRLRLRAYQRHHGVKVPNFIIVKSPVDLFNGAADTVAVVALVKELEQARGVKVELIIGDTLARLAAGANENSGEDMSVVVRHVDRIRQESEAHFALIHHSGKNAAMGARGWSGLRCATDTEIEVTADADAGLHAAEITKQRDIPGKGDRIGFRLQVVELGIGKWHQPITSCVVVAADAPAKPSAKRPSEIAGAIGELLTSRGTGMRKRELVDHFDGRYTTSAVYREVRKMTAAGKLREVVGIVGLVRQ
jgi:putative DNA primase/helicase